MRTPLQTRLGLSANWFMGWGMRNAEQRSRLLGTLLLAILLSASAAHAQRMDAVGPRLDAEPLPPLASWQTRRDYSRVPVALAVALPPLDDAAVDSRLREPTPGEPYQVGFAREIPEAHRGDLSPSLRWEALPGGSRVASFSVRSENAQSLRLAIRAKLPHGAMLRFFEPANPQGRYPVLKPADLLSNGAGGVGEATTRVKWSPVITGDTVGVEIEIPSESAQAGVFVEIVRVSHIARSLSGAQAGGRTSSKRDPTCEPVQAVCKNLPSCPSNAIMKITVTNEQGDSAVCTGTALNSGRSASDNQDNPYILGARHCIDSQALADSVHTDWRYEYQACGSKTLHSNRTEVRGGADLVAVDFDTDSVLLALRRPLPWHACLAGWDSEAEWPVNTHVSSIHHPLGGTKEWTWGHISGHYRYGGELDVFGVTWTDGATLAGSSGAGLFLGGEAGDGRLIGVLHGGTMDVCPVQDLFGRFDLFYASYGRAHLSPEEAPPDDDHANTLAGATGVLHGGSVSGELDHGRDADVFRVEVHEPGVLTVYTTGDLDTFGRLKTDDGTTVQHDDDSGYLGNMRMQAAVGPGTYFVKITGYRTGVTGDYRLHVQFAASSAPNRVLVPLFLSATAWAAQGGGRQGFVRVFNRDQRAGEIHITAIDDAGATSDTLTLEIGVSETRAFNSEDLENGNPQKGISQGIGTGSGDWRLAIESDVRIEVAAYVRTRDGFLSAMHSLATIEEHTGAHQVPIFNPASNARQRSLLRLINPNADEPVAVAIFGVDDGGYSPGGIGLTLPPGAARTLDAVQLEQGGEGLAGTFGDGTGKWRLFVEAEGDLHVVNLLDSVTGDLTNLSAPGAVNYE